MSRKPKGDAPAAPGVIRDVFGENPVVVPAVIGLPTPAQVATITLLSIAQSPAVEAPYRVDACEILVKDPQHRGLVLGVLVALVLKNGFGTHLGAQVRAARLILEIEGEK